MQITGRYRTCAVQFRTISMPRLLNVRRTSKRQHTQHGHRKGDIHKKPTFKSPAGRFEVFCLTRF